MSHLSDLRKMMAPKAELVLETLIVEGERGYKLIPEKRYAKMRMFIVCQALKPLSRG